MSLCDTCPKPGHCCKRFTLATGNGDVTTWADEKRLDPASHEGADHIVFLEELGRAADPDGREYVWGYWGCTKLNENGRCTIYETRPKFCREYEPASSPLCVLYEGEEK